jgi:hypothetical protein
MRQTKFSCKEDEIEFLSNFKEYGFKDKSAMVRESLNLLREKLESQRLRESAELYVETYLEDSELKALTDAALEKWPV